MDVYTWVLLSVSVSLDHSDKMKGKKANQAIVIWAKKKKIRELLEAK